MYFHSQRTPAEPRYRGADEGQAHPPFTCVSEEFHEHLICAFAALRPYQEGLLKRFAVIQPDEDPRDNAKSSHIKQPTLRGNVVPSAYLWAYLDQARLFLSL